MPSSHPKPAMRCAYLGPVGTYGHQAAKVFCSTLDNTHDLELIPCPTISDIYLNTAEYLVMPLQNIIQGGVIETIDSLLSPIAGPSSARTLPPPRIIADLDLPIRHSLVARRGTKIEAVRWVRSHEQALGQSSAFLAKHLPQAKQVHWASTAGAAMSLLKSGPEGNGGIGAEAGAAICSASAVLDHPELEVLYEGTQAMNDNFTRFILLTRHQDSPSHSSHSASQFYALSHPSLLSRFAPESNIIGIHTRPHPAPSRAKDRYPHLTLVEVGQVLPSLQEGNEEIVYLGSAVHVPVPDR